MLPLLYTFAFRVLFCLCFPCPFYLRATNAIIGFFNAELFIILIYDSEGLAADSFGPGMIYCHANYHHTLNPMLHGTDLAELNFTNIDPYREM